MLSLSIINLLIQIKNTFNSSSTSMTPVISTASINYEKFLASFKNFHHRCFLFMECFCGELDLVVTVADL